MLSNERKLFRDLKLFPLSWVGEPILLGKGVRKYKYRNTLYADTCINLKYCQGDILLYLKQKYSSFLFKCFLKLPKENNHEFAWVEATCL